MKQINHYLKALLVKRFSKLLDQLYFQEKQYPLNFMILFIFFAQKYSLLLNNDNEAKLSQQEIYFDSFQQFFSWITLQKPLEIIDSERLCFLITLLYTIMLISNLIIFWFSLYQQKFISQFQTYFIILFQLLILYQIQIHFQKQNYELCIKTILSIPLYLNYILITYCSRNYYLISKEHDLKKHSYFNYIIILGDYISYFACQQFQEISTQYILSFQYILYFIDAIVFKPYCQKLNECYIFLTFTLVLSAIIKINTQEMQFADQIYIIIILVPLCSILMILIDHQYNKNLDKKLSLQFIQTLGECISNSKKSSFERIVGKIQTQKFLPALKLNKKYLLRLFENYYTKISEKQKLPKSSQIIKINQIKEQIQVYIIFLRLQIQKSYLQSLVQTKKYMHENSTHSLFFETLSSLFIIKYDQQIKYQQFQESNENYYLNQKLIAIQKTKIFYNNHINEIVKVLDEKISVWQSTLSGFHYIEDMFQLVFNLNQEIQKIIDKSKQLLNNQNKQLEKNRFKNLNIASQRYFSFFYSYILNDQITAMEIENNISDILQLEDKEVNAINSSILQDDILILSASMLQEKGKLIRGDLKKIHNFFEIEAKCIKNINELMPEFTSKHHNNYIENFIKRGVSELNQKSKIVFRQTQMGFIIPIELSLMHINEISQDFILTAVLKKTKSSSEYIIFDEFGMIQGITESIYQFLFGEQQSDKKIALSKVLKDINVKSIMPALFDLIHSLDGNNQKKERTKVQVKLHDEDFGKAILSMQFTLDIMITIHQLPDIKYYICEIFNYQKSDESSYLEGTIVVQQKKSEFVSNEEVPTKKNILNKESNENLVFCQQQNLHKLSIAYQQNDQIFTSLQNEQLIPQPQIQTNQPTLQFIVPCLGDSHRKEDQKQQSISQNTRTGQYEIELVVVDKNGNQAYNPDESKKENKSEKQIQQKNLLQLKNKIITSTKINSNIKMVSAQVIITDLILCFSTIFLVISITNSNKQQSENVKLARLPDRFNRIYCSFTTIGQLDLERLVLGTEIGEYYEYRNRQMSKSLKLESEDLMNNIRNSLSNFEQNNQLQVRIVDQYSFKQENISVLQFSFLSNAYFENLGQYIIQDVQYQNKGLYSIENEYYQLQFLKANLVSQISASQNLINEIIKKIKDNQLFLEQIIAIIVGSQILCIGLSVLIQIYFWKKPLQILKAYMQLVISISDEQILENVKKTQIVKEVIQHHDWIQTNYTNSKAISDKNEQIQSINKVKNQFDNSNKLLIQKNKFQKKNAQKNKHSNQQRVKRQQFRVRYIYIKNLLLLALLLIVPISFYLFVINQQTEINPLMDLTLKYVQFKQDWDSLMILGQLLKSNQILTKQASLLGFINQNLFLQDQYFGMLYQEMLARFSSTLVQAESLNSQIFMEVVSQDKIIGKDQELIETLYYKDICLVLEKELPFCSYQNEQFIYFFDYPKPNPQDNNREIFKVGISGIFSKIVEIFQSDYQTEIQNINQFKQPQSLDFVETEEFKKYIRDYFFDINKAVIVFYTTILNSLVSIMHQNLYYTLLFIIPFGLIVLILKNFFLFYFLYQFQNQIEACKVCFTLVSLDSANHQFVKIIENPI